MKFANFNPTVTNYSRNFELFTDSFHFQYAEEDELTDGMAQQRAVHQCNVCNKIFVSYKGIR